MNRKDFERIANDELDGVALPAESEALRRHLAENAGAREQFEALREVFLGLNRVGLEEKHPGLHLGATAFERDRGPTSRSGAGESQRMGGRVPRGPSSSPELFAGP